MVLAAALLVQLFFLVNGRALFPSYWQAQSWDTWLPVYVILTLAALALTVFTFDKPPMAVVGITLGQFPYSVLGFPAGFGLAASLFVGIPVLRQPLNIPRGDLYPTLLFTIFVIALGEEILFRGFLNSLLYRYLRFFAPLVSSGAWTAFHWSHYGDQPIALLLVFGFGVLLGLLHIVTNFLGFGPRWGISLTWGLHAGYNMAVVGAFAGLGG